MNKEQIDNLMWQFTTDTLKGLVNIISKAKEGRLQAVSLEDKLYFENVVKRDKAAMRATSLMFGELK